MTTVFVDTGAFVALMRTPDPHHAAAIGAAAALTDRRVQLLSTNYVFAETYAVLLARAGRWLAIQWGASMRSSAGAVRFVQADSQIEDAAWQILASHEDKNWSYVDAVSFAVMERSRISTAFAFDQRFTQRGLAVIPAQA